MTLTDNEIEIYRVGVLKNGKSLAQTMRPVLEDIHKANLADYFRVMNYQTAIDARSGWPENLTKTIRLAKKAGRLSVIMPGQPGTENYRILFERKDGHIVYHVMGDEAKNRDIVVRAIEVVLPYAKYSKTSYR